MKNEERNTQPMSEWDEHVCARMDDLWNKHRSGELKAEDTDVLFANARLRAEEAINVQQAQKAELVFTQSRNYAI